MMAVLENMIAVPENHDGYAGKILRFSGTVCCVVGNLQTSARDKGHQASKSWTRSHSNKLQVNSAV